MDAEELGNFIADFHRLRGLRVHFHIPALNALIINCILDKARFIVE